MPTPTHIDPQLDLRTDPQARSYVKNEVVKVTFAIADGAIMSREGTNTYHQGDALITGSTGDHWSVTRDRFDAKYTPIAPLQHGHDGEYRNVPLPVLAKQMQQDFSVARAQGSDVIHGKADDWLMQYAPGDYGIVEQAKFAKVYRVVSS
jgi:hypothetical protein